MTRDPARFGVQMTAFATNQLLPTYFLDFMSHLDLNVPAVVHYYP